MSDSTVIGTVIIATAKNAFGLKIKERQTSKGKSWTYERTDTGTLLPKLTKASMLSLADNGMLTYESEEAPFSRKHDKDVRPYAQSSIRIPNGTFDDGKTRYVTLNFRTHELENGEYRLQMSGSESTGGTKGRQSAPAEDIF